ncbi:helix-turn-helix transcriptional regulator [Streptomyces sp. NPDC087866]|uniref:helix-turn-helix transcriptional regulator n=1 Tax=unclassified Streptomyces TaxID=2593676 RepID=UPI0033A4F0DF
MSDMRGENKWRMIVMDCLTPFLGSRSRLIARDFHCDLGDVRSNMFEAALDVWEETAEGVPPREVPTLMVKAAISAAYRGADVHEHESSVGEVETFLPFEESALSSVIKASSIVYGADPRDPVVVEQIRGERMGALWQRFGLGEVINRHHAGLGDGSRPGLRSSLATEAMLTRTFVTGSNRYYYASDLYPKFVDLPAAAKALGIARTTAYRMVRTGSFPCPTTYMGRSHQVPTKALMHSMSIADSIVHADDVENGAAHACGT